MAEQFNYEELPATRSWHGVPRFGHSSDMSAVFSEQSEERKDYLIGLIFAGAIILAFFLVWTIAITILPCLRQKRVGFFSGSALEVPYGSKRPRRIRIGFLISYICVITFAVLLVVKGLTQVMNTVDTVGTSAVDANAVVQDVTEGVDQILKLAEVDIALRDQLVEDLDNFCPNVDLEGLTNVNWNSIVPNASEALEKWGDLSNETITELRETMETVHGTSKDIQERSDNIELDDWQSLIIIVPYTVVPTVLMGAVLLAWFGKSNKIYTCLVSWIFLPLWVIMSIAAWVLCATVAFIAGLNADFCSGEEEDTLVTSPTGTVQSILWEAGLTEDDLTYQVISFYIYHCTNETPFGSIIELLTNLLESDVLVKELQAGVVNTTVNELVNLCGEEILQLTDLVDALATDVEILVNSTSQILDALSCERILPIYERAVYEGGCKYSIKGVTWLFSGLLVVAFFGMMMLTLRAARFPTVILEDKAHEEMMAEEAVEVEYEPYKAETPVYGGEENYGFKDEHVEDSYGGSASAEEVENGNASAVVAGVAVGAAAGAVVTTSSSMGVSSMSGSSAGPTEEAPPEAQYSAGSNTASATNEMSLEENGNWLDIDTAK